MGSYDLAHEGVEDPAESENANTSNSSGGGRDYSWGGGSDDILDLLKPPKPPAMTRVYQIDVLSKEEIVALGYPERQWEIGMLRLFMQAPVRCKPCKKGETLSIYICGGSAVSQPTRVEIELELDELWAGRSFAKVIQTPDPIVRAHRLEITHDKVGTEWWRMSAAVPDCKVAGQRVNVRMPEGIVKPYYVSEDYVKGVAYTPHAIFFAYDREHALAEAQILAAQLAERNRCCCADRDGSCLWYPNRLLIPKEISVDGLVHCPRLQEAGAGVRVLGLTLQDDDLDDKEICTRPVCNIFVPGCSETHHSPGHCVVSELPEFHFQGRKCL